MLLEPALVELGVVEGDELRGEAAEGPDESELSGDAVGDDAEPGLARELEGGLGSRCTSSRGSPVASKSVIAMLRL